MPKRTAQSIEERKAAVSSAGTGNVSSAGTGKRSKYRRGQHPNSQAAAKRYQAKPWPKGTSGNPSGKPGYDVPAYLARRAFERNQEAVYYGMAERLIAGEPYAFKEFADRGYGKLKETRSIELSGKITLEQALEAERRAERELNGNGGN